MRPYSRFLPTGDHLFAGPLAGHDLLVVPGLFSFKTAQGVFCVAGPTTQKTNCLRQSRTQAHEKIELFGLHAAWLQFANALELRRLAKLHMRIERRKRGLNDLISERQRIMNRCIRRMRRQQGKN